MIKPINNLFNLGKQVIRRSRRETMKYPTNAECFRRVVAIISLVMVSWLPPATAATITILPVQVCDNAGANCANAAQELYLAETNKIWAQAGIGVNFLAWDTWNSTANQNILGLPVTSPAAFFAAAPAHSLKAANPNSITMWFTKSMEDGTFGEVNAIGGDKTVIMDNVFSTARRDTLGHEIGHNLGLRHQPDNPGMDQTYLMWSGGRTIPGGVGDINPAGLKLDKLTAAQIATAQSSAFVVPLPGAAVLMVSGLGVLIGLGRKRLHA